MAPIHPWVLFSGVDCLSDPIQFPRQPYFVTYYKEGVKHTLRRVPPPKLHDMLPQDVVSLKERHNADWKAGEEVTVRHINPRHANTLQLEKKNGETTFVTYFDLDLIEEVGPRIDGDSLDRPRNNRYLLWP